MKRILILFAFVMMPLLSCNRGEPYPEVLSTSKVFNQNGVHFNIKSGCPLDSKAQANDYESYTIVGEKNGRVITLFVVDIILGQGLISSETYLKDGTLFSTAIIYNEKIMEYVLSPEMEQYLNEGTIATKARKEGEKYLDCVTREGNEMSENIQSNPIDRATCEWVPCETVVLIIAAFDCLSKESED